MNLNNISDMLNRTSQTLA